MYVIFRCTNLDQKKIAEMTAVEVSVVDPYVSRAIYALVRDTKLPPCKGSNCTVRIIHVPGSTDQAPVMEFTCLMADNTFEILDVLDDSQAKLLVDAYTEACHEAVDILMERLRAVAHKSLDEHDQRFSLGVSGNNARSFALTCGTALYDEVKGDISMKDTVNELLKGKLEILIRPRED